MAVRALPVAVSTTPVIAVNVEYSEDGARALITNNGATIVSVGGDDLTSANTATHGYPIAAGASITVSLLYGEQLYAVVPSATGSLVVLMSGVK